MAEARRRVFVGKVLERLFPRVPYGQEKRATLAPAPKNPPEKVTPGKAKCGCVPPLTGGDTEVQPGRRLYTVSLPPEGYVPVPPEPPRCTSSEHSSSGDDTGGAAADPDAVSVESAEQLLRCVEAGGVSPSDLCALGRLQALLLLRDAEGLRGALDAFPQRCALPPDHARVISAFFNYWITHILPEKNSE
ncbi:glutamate-rich protein 1 isoform 3-T4 [Hipposideros larvatus]